MLERESAELEKEAARLAGEASAQIGQSLAVPRRVIDPPIWSPQYDAGNRGRQDRGDLLDDTKGVGTDVVESRLTGQALGDGAATGVKGEKAAEHAAKQALVSANRPNWGLGRETG